MSTKQQEYIDAAFQRVMEANEMGPGMLATAVRVELGTLWKVASQSASDSDQAIRELREMHERLHELRWDDCEVCGVIRAALANQPAQPAEAVALREDDLDSILSLIGPDALTSLQRAGFTVGRFANQPAAEDRAETDAMDGGTVVLPPVEPAAETAGLDELDLNDEALLARCIPEDAVHPYSDWTRDSMARAILAAAARLAMSDPEAGGIVGYLNPDGSHEGDWVARSDPEAGGAG